jgi:hypothetical protein
MTPEHIAPASALLLLGTVIMVQQGMPSYRGARSRQWPRVTGRITSARSEYIDIGRNDMNSLTPDIRYE